MSESGRGMKPSGTRELLSSSSSVHTNAARPSSHGSGGDGGRRSSSSLSSASLTTRRFRTGPTAASAAISVSSALMAWCTATQRKNTG